MRKIYIMNKSRLPKNVKLKERKKIGRKKQCRYLQDRKKKSTSQKFYLPCLCKKLHTANHCKSNRNLTAINYGKIKLKEQCRYRQDVKKRQCPRRLYLPCKRTEAPHRHQHHQYRTKSDMSLGSIESSIVDQLVQDQNYIPTKAAGSWQVMPKDSIDLTKKRLRKNKDEEYESQKDDDTDDAQKSHSPKRNKKEPNINESSPSPSSSATSGSYHNLTSNSDEEK